MLFKIKASSSDGNMVLWPGILLTSWILSLPCVQGHGRLIEPPSRSSLWRFGFPGGVNYNDNQLFCGGYSVQWEQNGGRCGVCGDPWNGDGGGDNEAGGKYAKGIIVRNYVKGQRITVTVEITANHKGYFEFRLCPNNNPKKAITHECLNKHLLVLTDGTTRRKIYPSEWGNVDVELYLPPDVTCTQCVLQWKYNSGNSWGYEVRNGRQTGCVGCGPQEQFYGCADISISETNGQTLPRVSPTGTTTTETTTTSTTTTKTTTTAAATTASTTTAAATTASTTTAAATTASTTTATTPSSGNVGSCRGVGVWAIVFDLAPWCIINCFRGFCPPTHCSNECRPTPTTTTAPDPNGPCTAVGPWAGDPDILNWCFINCKWGYCPSTHCSNGCRPTPTTTAAPDPNGPCEAVGPWAGDPDILNWCFINCKLGYCPSSHCSFGCKKLG